MHRRSGLLVLLTLGAIAFIAAHYAQRSLRGELLSPSAIRAAIAVRADSDGNGLLTIREIRTALVRIVREVLLHSAEGDINGDGQVNRTDITDAVRALRAILGNEACGNGSLDGGEQCDDGNSEDGDGCSAECRTSVMWSLLVQGPASWDDARFACNRLEDGFWTEWRFPTVDELVLLLPELSRAGLNTTVWTFTRGQAVAGSLDVWQTFDIGAGQPAGDAPETSDVQALCVAPSRFVYRCTDSDGTANTGSTDDSIYTAGSVTLVASGATSVRADACVTPAILREEYCLGVPLTRDVYCPSGFGCLDGACNRTLPEGQNPLPPPQCMDSIDNDGDGVTDYSPLSTDIYGNRLDDPGCGSAIDNDESDGTTACRDGIDNDGDGAIDTADPSCIRATWNDEREYVCTDSDGGLDRSRRGHAELMRPADGVILQAVDDHCALFSPVNGYQSVSSCSGDQCYHGEWKCTSAPPIFPQRHFARCDRCRDGVCEP